MLSEKEKINCNEIIIFIICSLLGIDVLGLTSHIVKSSYQDAWLSVLIGSIYPLFIIFIVSKILPLCGDKTIVGLNKELFGKKFGNLLNIIFSSQFFFYTVQMTSSLVFVNKTFISLFINPIKICLALCIVVCFSASKGFKTIIRSCIVIFLSICILLLAASFSLKNGSIINFQPVLGSGFKSIFNGAIKTTYYYATLEYLLVVHPYVKKSEKKLLAKKSIIAILFSLSIYLWVVFINVYQLGVGLILKTSWSLVFTVQNINVPIFNSFRYVFLLLWNPIALISIIINLFIFCEVISKTFNIKYKTICYGSFPLFFMFSYILSSIPTASIFLDFVTPIFIIFNFLNFTTILFLLKRKNKNQKSLQNYN